MFDENKLIGQAQAWEDVYSHVVKGRRIEYDRRSGLGEVLAKYDDLRAALGSRHAEIIADAALAQILRDLRDRSGLGNEWDEIDVDIRAEIIRTWRGFIAAAITGTAVVRDEGRIT